jgi:NAD(P)-dependent dehydrogenase (short-subunit alcohol dehydrogenase family)
MILFRDETVRFETEYLMSDTTALVIGGTSGIGLATARRLAALGPVHVVGRSQARLDDVAASDPALIGHQADAGSAEQIEAIVAEIGTIDWLVLAASGGEGMGALTDLDLAAVRRAFEAKFWVHLTAARTVLPHLAPSGSITFIGAGSARSAIPGTAGLAAVNGAIEAMVAPLAVELAPIRVNGVSPGLVDTPWWSGLPEDARQAYFSQVAQVLPARRIATADDVAQAVVLAATNPNLTGTVIETDGGARLVSLP